MIKVKKEGVILKKTTLAFENEGVLNPAVFQDGNTIHILYRAVRKGNFSTIGYAKLEGPLKVVERNTTPLLAATATTESHGVEDPRMVKIDDMFYLTYSAYDGTTALGALATSTDLLHFEKQGIITPQITVEYFMENVIEKNHKELKRYDQFLTNPAVLPDKNYIPLLWDKNILFFPRKINEKFMFLHRIKPDIQIGSVANIADLNKKYWEDYFQSFSEKILLTSKFPHEKAYLGGGAPPLETEAGWLIIYHGVHESSDGLIYNACAALLDLENPKEEIARLPYPLFEPDQEYERTGYVNNVVFPTGTSLFGDRLYIYYGAADDSIAVASLSLKALLEELLTHKNKPK